MKELILVLGTTRTIKQKMLKNIDVSEKAVKVIGMLFNNSYKKSRSHYCLLWISIYKDFCHNVLYLVICDP